MPKAPKNPPKKVAKKVAKKVVKKTTSTKISRISSKKKVIARIEKAMKLQEVKVKVEHSEGPGIEKVAISKGPFHLVYKVRTVAGWFAVGVLVVGFVSIVTNGVNQGKNAKVQQASVISVAPVAPLPPPVVADDSISLVAVGDIMPARYVEKKMRALNDYTFPFLKSGEFLRNADITFGNLESPLFAGLNTPTDSMTFRADPQSVQGFNFAGFDVMSVANNHTMNYKEVGLLKAIAELQKAGIAPVGGGKNQDEAHTPAIMTVKGKKVAFYAYSDPNIPPIGLRREAAIDLAGVAAMDVETVKNDVKAALKGGADFVVVSMHAGREYKKEPTQFQKDFAHAAIDAGASVVIGAHAHVIQPVETYGKGVIFYGLGNFVFDQFFSADVRTGLVVKIFLQKVGEVPQFELYPAYLDTIQPRILEGQERIDAMARLGL